MTVQTLKLGGERYVLLKEEDFKSLKTKARSAKARRGRSPANQQGGDIAEAIRRLNDAGDSEIPYEQARKRLGLT
ncbi:MAG: hypothetical protein ABSG31_03065 [Tepidisphaeraceae bacterium]|jgi:hypothetical protein